jgi:hypothetical protein
MLLSQAQIDAAPAGTVKWFFVLVFALIVVAGAITGIIASFRRPAKVKMDDEPPIAVLKASPRYNHALAESRQAETFRRLDGHDAEIEQLWMTMRREDASIREENARKFEAIMLSLGRIEGELKPRK